MSQKQLMTHMHNYNIGQLYNGGSNVDTVQQLPWNNTVLLVYYS